MTTVPSIGVVSRTARIAVVAASSAASCFPKPIQRAEARAAASVTRTNSSVKLLSIHFFSPFYKCDPHPKRPIYKKVCKLLFKLRNLDRKSTRLNSSHVANSYAVFCLKKKLENKL